VCLANSAAYVFSFDISQPGEDFAGLLKKYPGKLGFIHTDVTNEESVKGAIDSLVEQKGRFDGLIANAGATKHQAALDFTMEQFEKLYKLNVNGSVSDFCSSRDIA
jgi:NAD(P)-dependent dehydrogenase (short-subunit alcohol dehydrogenase family)